MSRFHIDLSDFKHVSSDKDKTTLRSKKSNHQITIAHNAVHPEMRKVLESLAPLSDPQPQKEQKAEGGKVKEIHSDRSEPGYTEPKKMAEGGHASHEELSRGKTPYDMGMPCLNPNCKSHGKPHPNCRCYGFAEGGKVESACARKIPHEPGCEYYAEGGETEDTSAPPKMPSQSQAQAAQKGLNKPASEQISEGVDRLSNPSSWWAKGGKVQENPKLDESKKTPPEHSSPGTMSSRQPFVDGGDVEEITPKQGLRIEGADEGPGHALMTGIEAIGNHIRNGGMAGKLQREREQAVAASNPPQPAAPNNMSTGPATPPTTPNTAPDASQGQPPSPDTQTPPASNQEANNAPNYTAGLNTPAFSPNAVANQDQQQALQLDPQAQLTQSERQKFAHDHLLWEEDLRNQHVTPKTYQDLFNSQSTPGKIGTLFGLLVGGAGAGLTHQPSVVMNMMTKELENDFEAQKKSKDNAENFLRLQQQSPLIQSQTNLTNAQKQEIAMNLGKAKGYASMMHQLLATKNQYPEGTKQRQQADQMIQMIWPMYLQHSSNLIDGAAAISSLTGGGPGNTDNDEQAFQNLQKARRFSGDPIQTKQADIDEARHIPGVPGLSSRDIPEPIRHQESAMYTLNDKGRDLLNYMKQNRGTWNLGKRQIAEQKLEEMKNFYNDSISGGVLTEGRNSWYDEQLKPGNYNPTSIIGQLLGSTGRLNEVVGSNDRRREIMLQKLGFPNPGKMSESTSAKQSAPTNLSKSGREIIYKNGKPFYK